MIKLKKNKDRNETRKKEEGKIQKKEKRKKRKSPPSIFT
jgi:hypothetical protein